MKVTVIIPTYNGEKTIERAIKSVLNQNIDIQLLICDDCSTDKTIEIAKKYTSEIFINDNNSGGPNKGRNIGIKNSIGDYVAFLDQDDEWLPNKLEIQLKENTDVIYSQYIGSEKPESLNLYNTLLKRDKTKGWAYLGSLLIKNNNIPLFEEYFGQLDYDWLLRLTKNRTCRQVHPVVKRNADGNNLSFNIEYRKRDFYMGLLLIDGDIRTMKKWYSSRARYHYVMNDMKMARFYFIRGDVSIKTILYYISSYNLRLSNLIIKKFKVFG